MSYSRTGRGLTKPLRGAFLDWGHPLVVGLIHGYVFNDCGGTQAFDYGTLAAHGTLTNMEPEDRTGGLHGSAINFDGSNNVVVCASEVGPANGFTCAAWVQTDITTGALVVAAQHHSTDAGDAYFQFFRNTTNLHGRIHQVKDTTRIGRNSGAVFVVGNWSHIAMRWNGGTTNAAIELFVGGARVDTTDDGAGTFTAANTTALQFKVGGQGNASHFALWDGRIESVFCWNRALANEEIKQLVADPYGMFLPVTYRRWFVPAVAVDEMPLSHRMSIAVPI